MVFGRRVWKFGSMDGRENSRRDGSRPVSMATRDGSVESVGTAVFDGSQGARYRGQGFEEEECVALVGERGIFLVLIFISLKPEMA